MSDCDSVDFFEHPLSSSALSTSSSLSSSSSSSSSLIIQFHEEYRRKTSAMERTLYKTELCKRYQQLKKCRYGARCQFAHGEHEIRLLSKHPKYKTTICRTFATDGYCPYGVRCRFIHQNNDEEDIEEPIPLPPKQKPKEQFIKGKYLVKRQGITFFDKCAVAQLRRVDSAPASLPSHQPASNDIDGLSLWCDNLWRDRKQTSVYSSHSHDEPRLSRTMASSQAISSSPSVFKADFLHASNAAVFPTYSIDLVKGEPNNNSLLFSNNYGYAFGDDALDDDEDASLPSVSVAEAVLFEQDEAPEFSSWSPNGGDRCRLDIFQRFSGDFNNNDLEGLNWN